MDASDLLTSRARLTPDREALVELATGQRFTFRQLNERSNRLANFLRGLGVQKGDRVSILAHNSVIYADLLYGLIKIGAILTPLNWRLTARELAYIVNDCEPKILLVGPDFVQVFAELYPQIDVEHIIPVEGAQFPDGIPVTSTYEAGLAAASTEEPQRPPLDGEDTACIMYTSGTTGRPKGAMLPQRQVLWNCINTVISWGLTEHDVAPVFTPMFHSGGLLIFLAPLHYVGGKVIVARTFDPEDSLRVIQEEKCTVVLGVPTLFQVWLNSPNFARADFSHVHFFISGGAPCPVALMDAWRLAKGVIFRQGYGLTEVGTNCFSMTDEESARISGSVGRPIFHSQMRLVDALGQDVPPGETGELLIRGPHVCTGYWHNPEATAEALQNGWFHTGDMARQDQAGNYYIAGRFKDMIISGGENVYAAEVEAIFREHPAVADAALIGVPDEKWGEVGWVIVLLKPGQAAEEPELKDFAAQRLARYKIPKRIVIGDSLPYSPYGKVLKADLKKRYTAQAQQ